MFERFSDYMFYLLTAPFKRVKKSVNAWYKVLCVFGKMFDEVKGSFFSARDEGMIATCSEIMLKEHGRDRGLIRYSEETTENYRSRIALFEEICRLGGTNAGIVLSVNALGYDDVAIKSAKEIEPETEAWAEFYVVISLHEKEQEVRLEQLCKEVRKVKEVGAKDNYLFSRERSHSIYVAAAMTYRIYSGFIQED